MKDRLVTLAKGVFAFWRCTQYPYVLGGAVDAFDEDREVRIPSYGNAWVQHVKIVPTRTGERLLAQLVELQRQRAEALAVFEKEWDEKLFDLFPEARQERG